MTDNLITRQDDPRIHYADKLMTDSAYLKLFRESLEALLAGHVIETQFSELAHCLDAMLGTNCKPEQMLDRIGKAVNKVLIERDAALTREAELLKETKGQKRMLEEMVRELNRVSRAALAKENK